MTELQQLKSILVQVLKNQLMDQLAILNMHSTKMPENYKEGYLKHATETGKLLNAIEPLTKEEIREYEHAAFADFMQYVGPGPGHGT